MINKFILLFGIGFIVLLFSTVVAWYEGSEIVFDSFEWGYSTPLTHFFHGEVNEPADISPFDYFVYAAKFRPTFPILMIVSTIYLFTLIGYFFTKKKNKFTYFISLLGSVFLLISVNLIHSSTPGAQLIFNTFLSISILYIIISIVLYSLQNRKKSLIK
ncbi:YjdJ family protein [Heyndrickxia sporothermodurans]